MRLEIKRVDDGIIVRCRRCGSGWVYDNQELALRVIQDFKNHLRKCFRKEVKR